MNEVARYDYHLANLMAAMVRANDGETSLICNADIEEAKEIARKLADEEK